MWIGESRLLYLWIVLCTFWKIIEWMSGTVKVPSLGSILKRSLSGSYYEDALLLKKHGGSRNWL